MDGPAFRAALIASAQSAEMQSVRLVAQGRLRSWPPRDFPDLGALIKAVTREDDFPDLVIVCQGWRDQFSVREIELAFKTLPLARWICVYGTWCESEGRHGSRWPLAVRVPIASFATRLLGEIAVVHGDRPALPMTADREEFYEFDCLAAFPVLPFGSAKAVVLSPDREFHLWLGEVVREAGLQLAKESQTASAQLLLADLDPIGDESSSRIKALRRRNPKAKILAMAGLADVPTQKRMETAGADKLLAKTTPAAQLASEMQSAVRPVD